MHIDNFLTTLVSCLSATGLATGLFAQAESAKSRITEARIKEVVGFLARPLPRRGH